MTNKNAIIIGAGASGRGHIGQLAHEAGYQLVFLEKDKRLAETLKRHGHYNVRLVSARTRDVDISPFKIFQLDEGAAFFREFCDTALIFTTVCPNNLKDAADYLRPMVVAWLKQSPANSYKNILCCENMNNSSAVFKQYLLKDFPPELVPKLENRFGFVNTMIARVVAKPKDPLCLLGEEYSEWTADEHALRGSERHRIKTLEFVAEQEKYLQRKLFIHNTGHATFGYLGFLKGYQYIHEAAQDAAIMDIAKKAIEESGWAVQQEHGFSGEVIRKYRQALTDKCPIAELPDELRRVVREPLRKLGPDERFFGPAKLMLKHGRRPEYLLFGACAALLAKIPDDADSGKINTAIGRGGLGEVFSTLLPETPDILRSSVKQLLPNIKKIFC
jgi:mannitol-1-phosphate 5-dehydrogenase